MLMRHHDQTRELEMRQQKSVHVLREEHLRRQHDTELTNQVIEKQSCHTRFIHAFSSIHRVFKVQYSVRHFIGSLWANLNLINLIQLTKFFGTVYYTIIIKPVLADYIKRLIILSVIQ